MFGMTNSCGEDLCLEPVVVVDGANLPNHVHTDVPDGIEATDEGTDICRTALGCQQCLDRREVQGNIGLDSISSKFLYRLKTLANDRHFDYDVAMQFCKRAALFQD